MTLADARGSGEGEGEGEEKEKERAKQGLTSDCCQGQTCLVDLAVAVLDIVLELRDLALLGHGGGLHAPQQDSATQGSHSA